MINHKKFPKYSFLGFKILNSFHSILWAYILIVYEYIITRYFGLEGVQLIAGLFFSLFVNLSIFILIINFLIRLNKSNIFNIIGGSPLLVYLPFTINKIFLVISRLVFFFSNNILFS